MTARDPVQTSQYRKFDYPRRGPGSGDDYGMMRKLMSRRSGRLVTDENAGKKWSAPTC